MDWSDENNKDDYGNWCFAGIPTIDCNEHLCITNMWSCGDGQCINWIDRLVFQNLIPSSTTCANFRHMNYMCELSLLLRAWTMPTGLCWFFANAFDDPGLSMENPLLSNDEKCFYLIRCALSNGFERDCPCNGRNCSRVMSSVCRRGLVYPYPLRPLIRPYIVAYYTWESDFQNKMPSLINTVGNVRCRGYYAHLSPSDSHPSLSVYELLNYRIYPHICASDFVLRVSNSSIKYADDCWKNSSTFNGRRYAIADLCPKPAHCISQYRINDGRVDCSNSGDENRFVESEDRCTRVRRHRFQCSNEERTCLPSSRLGDGISPCSNGHDAYLYGYGRAITDIKCRRSALSDCELLKNYIQNSSLAINASTDVYSRSRDWSDQSTNRIPFRSYCDTFWHYHKHNDELPENCREWICHREQYQCRTGQCIPLDWVCDKQWDCADASDEEAIMAIEEWSPHNRQLHGLDERREKCREDYANLPFSSFCNQTTEFPCLRSNVSDPLNVTKNRPCIPYSKIGDEIEDCYNAYDEKNTFSSDDGTMWGFRLRCGKKIFSSFEACFLAKDTCAQILCHYRRNQSTNCSQPTDAICIADHRCVPGGRCNGVPECDYAEDEYWCGPKGIVAQMLYRSGTSKQDKHPSFDWQVYPSMVAKSLGTARALPSPDVRYPFICNRGVTTLMLNSLACFCSPAYFGEKCQFFSDRITILTRLQLSTWHSISMPTLFTLRVHFLFNRILIDQYEFHCNPTLELHTPIKHKFYLLYSRSFRLMAHKKSRFFNRSDVESNHPYSVHIDIYALYSNPSTPILLGVWEYPIYFDFLPAFRFATILRFPLWWKNVTLDPCFKQTCNENSTCHPIFNQNNTYFCACKSGFYGENCSQFNNACQSYCSPSSLCQVNISPTCICPLGHFGPRCFLRFEQCESNPCLNNGSCVYTYEAYGGDAFLCNCSKLFYGDRCEHAKMAIQVRLNSINTTDSARASTIQFYDVDVTSLQLLLQHQQLIPGVPSSIFYAHGRVIAPALSVLKTYSDAMEPKYFIIYIQPNVSSINISSSPKRCPSASILDDLSQKPNLFRYHHICRNKSDIFCFVDPDYLCICQADRYRVDCFMHDPLIDRCSRYLSNGKCLRGDINEPTSFLCLCPRCHRGDLCEFSIEAFGFTLDALLVDTSRTMKIVYLSIAFLVFFVGLFNNLCAFLTFKRPAPRKTGSGNYLFIITCFNQLSLLCLLVTIIQITFGVTNARSCQIVPYLFSVFTRLTYWLASWVTIDRLLLILSPMSTFWKKPTVSITASTFTMLSLFAMHIHEVIYYTAIQHLSTGSSICVTNFQIPLIFTYNRVSTLIHYLCPFLIRAIAVTLLIVLAARSRSKANAGKMTARQALLHQFRTQKELYVTPLIIILSALPQTIFTFSLACVELTEWRRHTLLVTYLLSYAPQVLAFVLYVLPSTTYKKEFSETRFAKKFLI